MSVVMARGCNHDIVVEMSVDGHGVCGLMLAASLIPCCTPSKTIAVPSSQSTIATISRSHQQARGPSCLLFDKSVGCLRAPAVKSPTSGGVNPLQKSRLHHTRVTGVWSHIFCSVEVDHGGSPLSSTRVKPILFLRVDEAAGRLAPSG